MRIRYRLRLARNEVVKIFGAVSQALNPAGASRVRDSCFRPYFVENRTEYVIRVRPVSFHQRNIFADAFQMMHHNFPQRTVAILTLVFKVRLTIFEMDLPGSISPVGSRPGNTQTCLAEFI